MLIAHNTYLLFGTATAVFVLCCFVHFVHSGFTWWDAERGSTDSIPWCAKSLGKNTREDGSSRPIAE